MATSGCYYGSAFTFNYSFVQASDPTAFFTGSFTSGEVKVITRDGATTNAAANIATLPTHESNGVFEINLSASETSHDEIIIVLVPSAADVVVESISITTEPTPGDVIEVSQSATAADNLEVVYDGNEGYYQAYLGFRGPGVYLNDAAANTNTVNGVDGTLGNPVSTMAAAKTICDSMSMDRIYLVNNTDVAITVGMPEFEFIGIGEDTQNAIDLGGVDSAGASFYNLKLYGDGSSCTSRIYAEGCALADAPAAAVTTLHIQAERCGFVDQIEIDTSNDNTFDQCYSLVAGAGYPVIVATGTAGTVGIRHYSGGIGFESLSGSHNVSVEGNGQVVFESSCNVNANVSIRGNFTITDNTAGMTSVTDAARWATDQLSTVATQASVDVIDTNVDAILVDTSTTIPGTIATVDTNVDAILVDTGTTLPAQISGVETKVDTVDANVDAILVDTGTTIPGTIATVDANVDAILVDTGTTLPATLTTIEGKVDTVDTVADSIKVDTAAILADTGTDGVVISTAQAQAIADEILKRSVATGEATAAEHSLATIILSILESSRTSTVWTIKRTDGVTSHLTKTLTLDGTAQPVTGVSD